MHETVVLSSTQLIFLRQLLFLKGDIRAVLQARSDCSVEPGVHA